MLSSCFEAEVSLAETVRFLAARANGGRPLCVGTQIDPPPFVMILLMRTGVHGLNMRRFLGLLMLLPSLALGHAPPPDHGCLAPRRPPDNVDETTWNRFLSDVDRYRSCGLSLAA